MLFQPTLLVLTLADALALVLLLPVALFAVQVWRHWDLTSGSTRQIRLERRTYLAATVVALVLLVQVPSLLLFVLTADRLAVQFVGAMCAVGTLNVNAWGFPALLLRIALFFSAAVWLVMNGIDNRAPDYPLIRAKYALLLGIVPLAVAAAIVQLAWVRGLNPDVITSCCGSLFDRDSEAVTAELAGLPPLPTMVLFYGVLGAAVVAGGVYARYRRGLALFTGLSALAFPVTIAAVIAFLSLYVYEHPHHHCPFCLLKPEYGYVGYALYLPLFGATALSLGLGVAAPLARSGSARTVVATYAPRLVVIASGLFAAVIVLSAVVTWRSHLNLLAP